MRYFAVTCLYTESYRYYRFFQVIVLVQEFLCFKTGKIQDAFRKLGGVP
jgi:hypothetical protein